MSNLMTISNVRGYMDEAGTAHLNLEDVARGLGFTQIAGSGNEVVRWERVKGYLVDLKAIPTCGDVPEFIPENIFYRLAMKAKNEIAEAFQTKVADEILPQIRKTGSYSTKPASIEDLIIMQAQSVKEMKQKVDAIELTQSNHQETLTVINHRLDNLDCCDTDGDLQQRLNAMVRKYAHDTGLIFSKAWREFREAYNTAFHTNLKLLLENYKKKHGFKELTIPQFLSITGKLPDAIRVADKMLNSKAKLRVVQ